MQITLIFHAFFDEAEKKISDGSTTKFILYVKKGLRAKIGACIRPVTINALSDLTITAPDKRTIYGTGQTNSLALCFVFGKTYKPAHGSTTQVTSV